ncbi:MAG: hypothetical protein NZ926_00110 [Candidatus Methanomethylicia archaeon]|nr:hypothetical protein [Candidatus Methanomethylicia archaeon]MCX8168838.1 hypothetical protein [Candidatus Methanomethylicia archaeon]MDW7988570.1 hypothetical protein [Nitrososphaerota archaeon]
MSLNEEKKKKELDKLVRDRLLFHRLIGETLDTPLQEMYLRGEVVRLLMKIIEDLNRMEKKIDEILLILKSRS